MIAAMDWCSHTTHDWIWLVICSFETVFPSVSDRLPKREKEKKKDRREKKMSKQPSLAPTAGAISPFPTIIQISRTPRH